MRVVLIGANGQLGSDIVKVFGADPFYQIIPINRDTIDVTNPATITAAIDKYHPEMIISTAAFHRVDVCETSPKESFAVNAFGVRNLALECLKSDITLVHFSTDYVFGQDTRRNTPYVESDAPGPVNLYGISKLAGEHFMKYLLKKYFIIRTSGLYGAAGPVEKNGNFVDNLITKSKEQKEISVVNDQILTPTYTVDLSLNLKELLKTASYGLYHITSEEQCSWFGFAQEILRDIGSNTVTKPVSTSDFYSPVKRPAYSVLENANLKKINLNLMKPWQDALKRYMKEKNYL